MNRLVVASVALVLGLAAVTARGDETPPWKRQLDTLTALKVKALSAKLNQAWRDGRPADARAAAEAIQAAREAQQGKDHWEAVDARWHADLWRRVAEATHERRAAWMNLFDALVQIRVHSAEGHIEAAEPLLRRVLDETRAVAGPRHPDTAIALNNLAASFDERPNRRAEAEALYRAAVAIHRDTLGERHPATATSWNNLATCLESQERAAEAEPLYRASLETRAAVLGDSAFDVAASHNNLGTCLNSLGRHADSEVHFRKALQLFLLSLQADHPVVARCRANLADCLDRLGRQDEAEPFHRAALAVFRRQHGDWSRDAGVEIGCLAGCLQRQGRLGEAEPLQRIALEILSSGQGAADPRTPVVAGDLALCLDGLRRHAEAERFHREVLAGRSARFGPAGAPTAAAHDSLGTCLYRQRRFADAERSFRAALAILDPGGKPAAPEAAHVRSHLAISLDAQGRPADAGPFHRAAVELAEANAGTAGLGASLCLHNYAAHLAEAGRDAEALPLAERAERLEAAERLTRAPNPFDRGLRETGSELQLPGLLVRLGRPAEAFEALTAVQARGLLETLASRRESRDGPEERRVQALRAERAALDARFLAVGGPRKPGDPEPAELAPLAARRRAVGAELADLAVAIVRRERASLDRVRAVVRPEAAVLCWLSTSDDTANVQFRYACVLRATGDPAWVRMPGTGPNGDWTPADARLAADFRRALETGDPEAAALGEALAAQRLGPVLPHLGGVRTLHVVGSGDMVGVPLEALTDRFAVHYAPSATALVRALERAARPLGGALLAVADPVFAAKAAAPAAPAGPPGGVFVSGVLEGGQAAKAGIRAGDALLSYNGREMKSVEDLLAALKDAKGAPGETIPVRVWRDGKTLDLTLRRGLLNMNVDRSPAAEIFARAARLDRALAPPRDPGTWKELPGTRVELARVAAHLPPAGVLALTDADASLTRLREAAAAEGGLARFRRLHFATHGEADDALTLQSALVLANGQRLTAAEVLADWKLDADLVTLSACSSGLGRVAGSEGHVGFAQAFLVAGARSVCLSLWEVDDGATTLLMGRFSDNLRTQPKAEALREARAWLRDLPGDEVERRLTESSRGVRRGKERALPILTRPRPSDRPYAHPYYWAGFVLIGDPR